MRLSQAELQGDPDVMDSQLHIRKEHSFAEWLLALLTGHERGVEKGVDLTGA